MTDRKRQDFPAEKVLPYISFRTGHGVAMADNSGYTAYLTDDLASGTFTKSGDASFVDGRFRHGTVMRLSETEQTRLLEAYGQEKTDSDEPEAEDPVLEYNFRK